MNVLPGLEADRLILLLSMVLKAIYQILNMMRLQLVQPDITDKVTPAKSNFAADVTMLDCIRKSSHHPE